MVVGRSPEREKTEPAAAAKKRTTEASKSGDSQIIEQRTRSKAAAASRRAATTSGAGVRETWIVKPPQAREFEAALGEATFPRVTGSYTPQPASPAWDNTMDDEVEPFHRSSPSHERTAVGGVSPLGSKKSVRLDISSGKRQTAAAGGDIVMTAAAVTTAGQEIGGTVAQMVSLDSSVSVVTAVSTSVLAAAVDSNRRAATTAAAVSSPRFAGPVSTTNPFGERTPAALLVSAPTTGVASLNGTSSAGRGLARRSVSPIPSCLGAVRRDSTTVVFTSASGIREEGGSRTLPRESTPVDTTIAKGYHLMEIVRLEFEGIDINMYTPDLLKELCLEANSHKKALARVEEKLLGVPDTDRQRGAFAVTRARLVNFIRNAQRRVCEEGASGIVVSPTPPRASTPAPLTRGVSALSLELKRDRVIAQEHRLLDEMTGVTEEAKAVQRESPMGDSHIKSLYERSKCLKDRASELAKEAMALYNDAVDADLASPAKALHDCMQLMQSTIRDAAARLTDLKVNARIGLGGLSREIDFPAPSFAGGNDEDVYRFCDLFDQYVDAKGFSDSAALRAMRAVCLKGQLAITCGDMEELSEIKSYLLDVYGQPRMLLESRVKEVTKLGKCPTYPAERRRDWLIKMQNQLNYLLKICRKFHLLDELMFSPVLRHVHDNLPTRVHQDYLEAVAELPREERTRRRLFNETLNVVAKQVLQATADVNTNHVLGLREAEKVYPKKSANVAQVIEDSECEVVDDEIEEVSVPANPPTKQKRSRTKRRPAETVHQVTITADYTEPKMVSCVACKNKHSHMFYCPVFQKAGMDDRIQIAKAQGACRRCLRSDSQLDLTDRRAWFARHEANCKTEWTCQYEWTCGKASPPAQFHMLLCKRHARHNKDLEEKFVKSLDQAQVNPGTRFFFSNFSLDGVVEGRPAEDVVEEHEVIHTSPDQAIYMLQTVFNQAGEDLLMFYDSGCSVAAISQKASKALGSRNLVPGPFDLNVAGGQVVENQGGLDEFELELCDGAGVVQMRGLVMDTVTNPFARYNLMEAFEELRVQYGQGEGAALPQVPREIGGSKVDVMIGIKYLAFFPELVFSLPSGLAIFESKFRSMCGRRGIIGGPHHSWTHASERIEYMSAYAFLTAELRAYQAQARALDVPLISVPSSHLIKPWQNKEEFCGCGCHSGESSFTMQESYRQFQEAERVGSELTYRCVRCRNCADCRKGELLEEASLQEEAEQALIESSVWLEPENGRLMCRLPFVKEPAACLTDNRAQAEKIFASQLRTFTRNPAMKEAVLAAHDKLLTKGHVVAKDHLTKDEQQIFDATPGSYTLPWSCVAKADSVSTPFRVVFNASFKTRSGDSLNTVLAKGANKLPLILSLLVRFSSRPFALAADVSMAYNAVKLVPEHFKYQQYLWKEGLDDAKPLITMIIRTLIYGVRPSGNLTGAGFVRLADYASEHFPHLAKGADVIRNDTYVDDSVASFDSLEECRGVASAMVEVLSFGGAAIKDFAFSTLPPSDKLSTDGVHVGVLGYLWNTVREELFLAVRPTVIGKSRKDKQRVEQEEDIWAALKSNFTKRTLQGQLARIYDPKGFATPVTALIKLDLAEVVALGTGWDEPLPEELLPKWVENLVRIHRLRRIPFPRSVVSAGARSSVLDLIVSVDASKDVAVAAVHARSRMNDGSWQCRLLVAKSKLVHMSTVPRGELRAAAMGATLGYAVATDLGEQVNRMIFVSDSTIVLFWMAHDTRPLQTAVRNAVIEIRRLTSLDQWFHVASEHNVADVGTRYQDVEAVNPESEWVKGKPWMSMSEEHFPLRSIEQVSLDAEEARQASKELKVGDHAAHSNKAVVDKVSERYKYSNYVVDPCNAEWPKAINVLAMVLRFVSKLQLAVQRRKEGRPLEPVKQHLKVTLVTEEERSAAEAYFFRKATAEVRRFMKASDYEPVTIERDGILFYKSRVLDGQVVEDHNGILGDVKPMHFVRPVVDRHSPVAYSVMRHVHERVAKHMNPVIMLRESRELCFIFKGRDLAVEIANLCSYCKKKKAQTIENQMAAQHPATLTVGPAFSTVQMDMAGPWHAECEHLCRSTVKVWALVLKDPATCAVAAYAMPASNSAGFIQAYNRHAFRHGHPVKVYIDAGSQLLKACEKAELSWLEISHLISSHYGVGFDYEVCPPHAHYFHGAVERSIKEVKRLFDSTFRGLKLHLLAYETAFSYCCNQLNNLPISLGTRTDHLGHRDVLTPNRLIMGRNNKRAPASITQVPSNSRLAEQLESVERSWWKVWESERLVDFVPQPAKWPRTNNTVGVGSIVIFPMAKPKAPIGEWIWKYGKVSEVLPSRDGLARRLKITYQNYKEEVWRYVIRGAREVAVIHEEGDLEFFRELRKLAEELEGQVHEPTMAWQGVPHEENADVGDVVGDFACSCIRLD